MFYYETFRNHKNWHKWIALIPRSYFPLFFKLKIAANELILLFPNNPQKKIQTPIKKKKKIVNQFGSGKRFERLHLIFTAY